MTQPVKKGNDLQTQFPDIAAQWHPYLNGPLRPSQVSKGCNKKIWWLCESNHAYECTVDKRTSRGQACPYCSGKRVLKGFNDLETIRPDIAEDWDYSKNVEYTPQSVTPGSNKKAYWKCNRCGYEWRTKINDRFQGNGCPQCSKEKRIKSFRENYLRRGENDLETLNPSFLNEWDPDKNMGMKPSDYTGFSKERIWWKCSVCGFEWQATITNRYKNQSGCPKCMKHRRTSFPEQAIFFYLQKFFPDTVNSYTEIFDDNTELDVFVPSVSVGIEYDGKAWHTNARSARKTIEKYKCCKENGIILIRITEIDLQQDDYSDFLFFRSTLLDDSLNEVICKVLDIVGCSNVDVDVTRDRSEILKQYITVIKSKSIAYKAPLFVDEWDVEKNGGLTADMVNANSAVKYWWKCSLGHSYQASPSNKINGNWGCSVCSGHQLLRGFNDFAARYPEIAKKWDDEKNYPVRSCDIKAGSQVKYYWKCEKGHSFIATPNNMVYATSGGCSVCTGKQVVKGYNDLPTTASEVMKFWDYDNNIILPDSVTKGSGKRVWWKCDKDHTWKKTIASQVLFNSCPYCEGRELLSGFNDLAVRYPKVADEWDREKNGDQRPENILPSSLKRVWWKCNRCGFEWRTSPYARIKMSTDCPKCGYSQKIQSTWGDRISREHRDLVSLFPEIAAEWDYERNIGLNPARLAPGSNKKVWWICSQGHHYEAWMSDRTGKHHTGCPYCARKRKLPESGIT